MLASTIQKDLGLDRQQYSYVTFSFLATYMVMYAVGGRIVDWLGTRRGLMLFATGWSVANMLHALSRSLPQLMFFRALLGVTEAANIPAGVKAVSEWFPVRERALAVGIFNAGTAIGGALAVPIVSTIALLLRLAGGLRGDRRAGAGLGGGLGGAFTSRPTRHPRLGAAERALILRGPAQRRRGRPPPGCRCAACWPCARPGAASWRACSPIPSRTFSTSGSPSTCRTSAASPWPTWPSSAGSPSWRWPSATSPPGPSRAACSRGAGRWIARASAPCWRSRCAMPLLCLAVTQVRRSRRWRWRWWRWSCSATPPGATSSCRPSCSPPTWWRTVSGLGGALGAAAGALTQLGVGKVVQAFSFKPVFAVCSGMYLIGFVLVTLLCRDLGRLRKVD